MITKLLLLLKSGAQHVIYQPRILFVLMLVVIFPLLLTTLLQQFLVVAHDNYTTSARLRIGTVHDAAATVILLAHNDSEVLDRHVSKVLEDNIDIEEMVIAKETNEGIMLIASRNGEGVGEYAADITPYMRALATPGVPISFEYYVQSSRYWDTSSTVTVDNQLWFVVTRQTFEAFDSVLDRRELTAYGYLMIAFLFLFGLGYWLVRDLDYRTKFFTLMNKLDEQAQISNMIAHELRSPLTAMRGYASMITDVTEESNPVHEHASRISEASERMVRLVSDFLEVARLQSGNLKIVSEICLPAEIIERASNELRPLALEKGLEFIVSTTEAENVPALTDPARLHQVLTNITSNAIKYTPSGRISIEMTAGRKTIEIRIKDTGSGISAEDQQKLFAPFFRVQNEYTSSVTGTGLGMWITKQLVERLGGTIGVESIKGVGTNVVVTLPRAS